MRPSGGNSKIVNIAFWGLPTLFIGFALCRFNLNDFMYVVSPSMAEHGDVYREVPFMQTPLVWDIGVIVHRFVGDRYLYIGLRILSLFALVGSGGIVYRITRELSSQALAVWAWFLFFTSYYLAYISREVANYSFATIAVLFAILFYEQGKGFKRYFFTGLWIGVATYAKISHGLFLLPFAGFIVGRFGAASKPFVLFGSGVLIGTAPSIARLLVDPEAFYFYNVQVHQLINMHRRMGPPHEYKGIIVSILQFLQVALLPVLLVGVTYGRSFRTHHPQSAALGRLIVLMLVASVAALLPGIIYDQYFATLAALLAIATPVAWQMLTTDPHWVGQPSWIRSGAVILACGLWSFPYLYKHVLVGIQSYAKAEIPALKLLAMQTQVKQLYHHSSAECPMSALSLSALPLLGTGFDIDIRSAAGPFLLKLDTLVHDRAPRFTPYASLSHERTPMPGAILVGYFEHLKPEADLRRYAVKHRYQSIDLGSLDGHELELFLHPACYPYLASATNAQKSSQ